jgi:hypothetical protein
VPIKQIKDSGFNLDIKNPNAVEAGLGDVIELLSRHSELLADIENSRRVLRDQLRNALSAGAGDA